MKIRTFFLAALCVVGMTGGLLAQTTTVFANDIQCASQDTCNYSTTPNSCNSVSSVTCSCPGEVASCVGTYPGIFQCGAAECSTGEYCQCTAIPPQTHKECIDDACVTKSGPGVQACDITCDKDNTTTHKACSGTSCTTVAGAGTDSCTNNASCGATRNACLFGNSYSCGPVPEDGIASQCNTPADCYGQPSADIKANNSDGPITINSGSNVTLSWGASVSDVCNASGDWSGEKGRVRADGSLDGSESFGPITSTKTFTITCTGSTGSATDSVTVNVGGVQSGTVQGVKVHGSALTMFGPGTAVRVSLNGVPVATADTNPYGFSLAPNTYSVSVDAISGWALSGYTLCVNNTNCHNSTPIPSNTAPVTITSGGSNDLWWHYTELPIGSLDSVTCDAISGWARDPDSDPTASTANASVVVQLFNGIAGQGGVFLGETSSSISRESAVGSHGFSWPVPITLKDGATRQIYAYGIDAQDPSNSKLLDASPKPLTCAPVASAHVDLGVIMTGPGDASWRVGAPDNANWVGWNFATNWSDSHDSIPGTYTVEAKPIAGFTVRIDGVERNSASIQSTEGTPIAHTWVIEYEEMCPAGTVELEPVPLTVTENQTFTVPWRRVSGCAHAKDLIKLVPVGATSPTLSYKYWNNAILPPSAKPTSANGSVTFTTPAGVSSFQAVYFDDDGFREVGRSDEIEVVCVGCEPGEPMAFLGCKSVSATGTIGSWQTGPCTVPFGESTEIKWGSANATDCVASSDPQDIFWHGAKSASGTVISGPITGLTNFDIVCNGPGGASESDRVIVDVEEETIPFVGIEADGTGGAITIDSGDDVTISWDSDNASGCTVAPTGWTGISGSRVLTDQTVSRTYTATCTAMNNTSTVSDSVTVNITPPDHLGCLMIDGVKSCSRVSGAGADACSTVSNCESPNFHSECDGNACVMVSGGGRDECANNDQCSGFGWHRACRDNSCAFIEGNEDDSCSDDIACGGNGFCSFGAAPNRLVVPPTKATRLSWDCGGVTNCRISQNVGSDVSGSLSVLKGNKQSRPSATTEYTLSCEVVGTGEEVSSKTTVRVFNFDGGILKEILPK